MNEHDLRQTLHRLDRRGYPAYKELRGQYDFSFFTLHIDHVQGDPFAAPSRFRVWVPAENAGFPAETYGNQSRAVALRDFLARRFSGEATAASDRRGSGKSGLITLAMPGQEILDRSSVFITPEGVEARFLVGLPAQGRRILGRQAAAMICDDVPHIATRALIYRNLDAEALNRHITVSEDADAARAALEEKNLCAFVANGSVLPRRSGVDDRPLAGPKVVPFRSPPTLAVTLELPTTGTITGMGIPRGVTLIVGGGYHGKSTLLRALERGVYNHVPGDGREFVVTDPTAVKIRAEDGRRIATVDISGFISNLPDGTDTTVFSSENASGSTSQAANIIEAIQAEAACLLLDEDTCATNFMIRDRRMQELVAKTGEPITPFIDRVRELYETYNTSSILVMGGSGDYFEVADTVILMDSYVPEDATPRAKKIATAHEAQRSVEVDRPLGVLRRRRPLPASLDPSKGRRDAKISARGLKTIVFGRHDIDVGAVEQFVDSGQLQAVGQALYVARERFMDGRADLGTIADRMEELLAKHGLDALDSRRSGVYVRFRKQEFMAALNRLRTLRVEPI